MEMHGIIADIVRSIAPFDAIEQAHIDSTLSWIESGAPLCRIQKPDIPPQHLVSYFVLFDPSHQKLLLVDHKKAKLWLPSGGHVEPGEDPQTTVKREVQEELSLDAAFFLPGPLFITVTETVGITAGHTDVSLWYVLRGDSTQSMSYDTDEFHQIAWFPLQSLPLGRCDPHMARFAMKLQTCL